MCVKDTAGNRARFEQHKAEQDSISHNAPNRADGVAACGNPLDQHRVNGNAYQNEHPLKAHSEQGTKIVLAHLPHLPVGDRCHGDGSQTGQDINFQHSAIHQNKNDNAQRPHGTLEMAVDDDYIRKNPSKGIYRKLKTDGSAPKPKRRIALTKTQQQNFLRFSAKSPTYSHWLPIMTVLLETGMRVAECTGITKSDINLSENTISVNHNLIYRVIDGKAGFHITTPKTESGTRIVPILYPEVAEQLRLQIETIDALYPDDQLVLGGVHGFVFRNRTGSFMSAHNINRAIERISVTYNMEEMDQAELEDREPDLLPHFSVHNLRHTFCTRLCESTNDVKFIQQVMGHADFSTTMDIYTHITQENMQEKAKNISVNMKLM